MGLLFVFVYLSVWIWEVWDVIARMNKHGVVPEILRAMQVEPQKSSWAPHQVSLTAWMGEFFFPIVGSPRVCIIKYEALLQVYLTLSRLFTILLGVIPSTSCGEMIDSNLFAQCNSSQAATICTCFSSAVTRSRRSSLHNRFISVYCG